MSLIFFGSLFLLMCGLISKKSEMELSRAESESNKLQRDCETVLACSRLNMRQFRETNTINGTCERV